MTDALNDRRAQSLDSAAPWDASALAVWLKANPEFFLQHEDVFAALRLPHPQGGHAISMVERQLITLRDRTSRLEQQLAELIGYGQHNDGVIEKLPPKRAKARIRQSEARRSALTGQAGLFADSL